MDIIVTNHKLVSNSTIREHGLIFRRMIKQQCIFIRIITYIFLIFVIIALLEACSKVDISDFNNKSSYNNIIGRIETDTLPNIVLIVVDDLGWGELGVYGNVYNSTPNIDNLAQNGMLFMEAYSTSPVCSPSRASIITGKLPKDLGIIDYFPANQDLSSVNFLPEDEETIPSFLKDEGYRCVHIGKWHLADEAYLIDKSPKNYGFHEEILNEQFNPGSGDYWYPYSHIPQYSVPDGSKENFLTNSIRDETIRKIKDLANEPFFLHINFYAVHSRLHPLDEKLEYYINDDRSRNFNLLQSDGPNESWNMPNNPYLAAMLETIDDAVGSIINTLRVENIYENTLLIFTSDNGGPMSITNNGGLRGGKNNLFEGGIRIPLIVHYPQINKNVVCSNPVWHLDIFPTIKSFFSDTYNNENGVSLFAGLNSSSIAISRTFFWHYPTKRNITLSRRAKSSSAIRKGDYKLLHDIEDKNLYLFDLSINRDEKTEARDGSKVIQMYRELKYYVSD